MVQLTKVLVELETRFPQFAIQKKSISEGSVGWHCEHSIRVIISIVEAMEKANPDEYTWTFNWKRSFVLFKGKFPRGIAKAPKRVLPVGEISIKKLIELLAHAKTLMSRFNQIPPNAFFKHPYFGLLNKKAAARFLTIHTKHHVAIIEDILR